MYIYVHCIYFSEILALRRYSSIRVEIKSSTTTTTTTTTTAAAAAAAATTTTKNAKGSSVFHRIS